MSDEKRREEMDLETLKKEMETMLNNMYRIYWSEPDVDEIRLLPLPRFRLIYDVKSESEIHVKRERLIVHPDVHKRIHKNIWIPQRSPQILSKRDGFWYLNTIEENDS